ncbi:MAG: ABC transporter substrate-binding protein, partial [Pseudomonadota bacterium]
VRKLLAGLALAAALVVAPAAKATEAEAYVRDIAAKLEPLLQNGKVTPKSVDEFLQSNIAGELDMNRIAKYVLRKHWKAISNADQKRFKSIFRLFIVENFKRQLVKYSNAEIRIIRSVEHKPEGVSVITRIRVPSKSPLNMNWRLFREDDELKIFDVSVQGISKLSATRAEYKSVLEEHGFDYLLEQICERLENPNKAACTPG